METNVKSLPISFVPTPTREYRAHRKNVKATLGTIKPAIPSPIPLPKPIPTPIPIPPIGIAKGSRVLVYKQDPSVSEIGIRKAFIPGSVLNGPRDIRITNGIPGLPPVNGNVFRDFIETPGTDAFDAVHAFAVARMVLTMYERILRRPVPWQWNSPANTDPINLFPHAGVTQNAYYSRTEKALKFFYFTKPGDPPGSPYIYTCKSLDIVAHEMGHAVLDGLKPQWIGVLGNSPQTGGLHESFGDLTSIFLALSQLDQVEAVIAQTKSSLHDKTFLSDLAEQFGLALGRPNGLRNADNDLKLSEVGTEVHAISQVFTGAMYDILADIFAFERNPLLKDDAAALYEAGQYLLFLLIRALIAAPDQKATYADVANAMLGIVTADHKPVQYRNFIRNRFALREVVVSPTPLSEDMAEGVTLTANIQDDVRAVQDRRSCCGTMQLPEFTGVEEDMQKELEALKKAVAEDRTNAGPKGRR
jgi:hypothetical protein